MYINIFSHDSTYLYIYIYIYIYIRGANRLGLLLLLWLLRRRDQECRLWNQTCETSKPNICKN